MCTFVHLKKSFTEEFYRKTDAANILESYSIFDLNFCRARDNILFLYIYKIFFSGKRAHRSRRLTKSGVRVSFCRLPWRACQAAVLVSYPLEAVSGAYLGDQWGAAAWFTLAATTRASGFLIKASHIWDSTLFRCELERSSAGLKKKKERKKSKSWCMRLDTSSKLKRRNHQKSFT